MNPRAKALLEACPPIVSGGIKTTVFHTAFGTETEFALTSSDIDLGAIAHLSPLENPSLVDMKLAYGERTAVTWLLPHLAALNAASGASNRMDAAALSLCCRDVIGAFPWLTLAEFCVFCSRMRSLHYVRKRSDYVFSSDTIMHGLREFHEDLMMARQRYDREHKQQPDYTDCVSHEQALSSAEYRQALDEENKKITGSEKSGEVEKKVTSKDIFRPVPESRFTEREFVKRRDEQLSRLRMRYSNSAQ